MRIEDLDILLQMANTLGIMPGTTICGLADGAAWPIKNALTKFRGEFEDYILRHQNPAVAVIPLQETIAHGRSAYWPNTSMPDPLIPLPGPNTWVGPQMTTRERDGGSRRDLGSPAPSATTP